MARLAVTLAVIFSLLALSHARIPFNLPANDVTESKPLSISSESDATIRLPSDVPEIETEAVSVRDLTVSDNTNGIEAIGVTARPLTLTHDVRFRPINRHFHHMHVERPFRVRFPHRCRHHRRVVGPWLNTGEISYGNDMVVSKVIPSDAALRDEMGQIPVGFRGFSVEGRRFPDWASDVRSVEEEQKGGFWKRFGKFLNRF